MIEKADLMKFELKLVAATTETTTTTEATAERIKTVSSERVETLIGLLFGV